jgi:diguanylate cyclase (GGDEF)-like protein
MDSEGVVRFEGMRFSLAGKGWLVPAWGAAVVAFLLLSWWIRRVPLAFNPLFFVLLEVVGAVLVITYAANMIVRFRGTQDRISLILAFAFCFSGLLEAGAGFILQDRMAADPYGLMQVPLSWMISRTVLAVLLVAALVVEMRLPYSRNYGRDIAATFLVVAGVAYVTSAAYLHSFGEHGVQPTAWVPRPWELVPALFFLMATVGHWERRKSAESACDHAVFFAAALNLVAHLISSQAASLLGFTFALAHGLIVTSYVVVLGGALVDNARLFDQVRRLAISDALTGLANYRRFVETLEAEIQRSQRTGRAFSLILLDLDGLKRINDSLGHLVGTRAILRIAEVLKGYCRVIDTAARYGGDEFALVLPETNIHAAQQVARRIRERVAADAEQPQLSASLGIAVYPQDGETLQALMSAADRGLYRMKGRRKKKVKLPTIAASF